MDRRFFHRLGASLLERTICSQAGKVGLSYTLGASIGMDMERFVDSKLIILWGTNPITSSLHLWSRIVEAKRRGAKVIAIDPYQQPVGSEVRPARRALAGHRRRARARADARADSRRADRSRLQSIATRSASTGWPGACVAEYGRPSASRPVLRARRRGVVEQARSRLGTIKPAGDAGLNYGMLAAPPAVGMAMRNAACLPASDRPHARSGGRLLAVVGGAAYPVDQRRRSSGPDVIP
jgi:hypothetical protein